MRGDAQTDTEFIVRVSARDGTPAQFQFAPTIAESEASFLSDGDPATWQRIGVCLDLPSSTDFVAISVAAYENVFNDDSAPSFDGHFADDVVLTLLPSCPSDTNGDGVVDFVDLLGLLAAWGGNDPTYDIEPPCVGDGVVDFQDLLAVLAAWGTDGCSSE